RSRGGPLSHHSENRPDSLGIECIAAPIIQRPWDLTFPPALLPKTRLLLAFESNGGVHRNSTAVIVINRVLASCSMSHSVLDRADELADNPVFCGSLALAMSSSVVIVAHHTFAGLARRAERTVRPMTTGGDNQEMAKQSRRPK